MGRASSAPPRILGPAAARCLALLLLTGLVVDEIVPRDEGHFLLVVGTAHLRVGGRLLHRFVPARVVCCVARRGSGRRLRCPLLPARVRAGDGIMTGGAGSAY